jgi:hypothetical protein
MPTTLSASPVSGEWPREVWRRAEPAKRERRVKGDRVTSLNDTRRTPRAADVAAALLARIRKVEEENRRLRAELEKLRRRAA